MFYVYVLKSKSNSKHYIGHTENLEKRVLEHNTNGYRRKFTCVNGPRALEFFETCSTRADAMKYERFLKTGKGRKYIKEKIRVM